MQKPTYYHDLWQKMCQDHKEVFDKVSLGDPQPYYYSPADGKAYLWFLLNRGHLSSNLGQKWFERYTDTFLKPDDYEEVLFVPLPECDKWYLFGRK